MFLGFCYIIVLCRVDAGEFWAHFTASLQIKFNFIIIQYFVYFQKVGRQQMFVDSVTKSKITTKISLIWECQ